jgi:hypothetical protein
MTHCQVIDLEEELDAIIRIIYKKLNRNIKEIYIINSTVTTFNDPIIKEYNNIIFYFVQFLPSQYSYRNIDNETDGKIIKNIKLKISDSYYRYNFIFDSTQKFYYKIKN